MYLRGKRLNKKVFLCILFLVQILLIGIFIGFGSIYTDSSQTDNEFLVQFVKQSNHVTTKSIITDKNQLPSTNNILDNDDDASKKIKVESIDANFLQQFFYVSNDNGTTKSLCFRDGTIVPQQQQQHRLLSEDDNNTPPCECQLDYHGRDCGQPEVIWRAFMTAKIPLNITEPRRKPHKFFYMIHASAINLETIEMQVQELINVVDLFIFCNEQILYNNKNNNNNVNDDSNSLSLRQHIKYAGVFKQYSSKILIVDVDNHKCTSKLMYKKFRQHHQQIIQSTDILLYSNADEILNWRAIKYLKWYDNWAQPIIFRLRYTVYGYFWQHPDHTQLGSVAGQISVLDEVYKSDPDQMALTKHIGMIIGDLNHAGGWFCQYCYHPMNIVRQLIHDGNQNIFLLHKKSIIDSIDIEKLIANGLYVDGKIGLKRLHKFSDKYYAPDHITNSTWKYESILTNIYVNYDDNGDDYFN